MRLLGLHEFSALFALIFALGGAVLTMHWLWMRPRLRTFIKEELQTCQSTRACNPGGAIENQLIAINSKLDALKDDVKYVRSRVDSHINGHVHGS
jgi:hypothetical protein